MHRLPRPEGSEPEDFHLSRRAVAVAAFGGYALCAFSADAAPIHTDAVGLDAETLQLGAGDRLIPAYLARPAGKGPFPAVLVVSEVFGVHEYIRDVCRRLAKLGYVAIAPDLFVRSGDPSTTSNMDTVRKIVSATSDLQVMRDVAATVSFLKAHDFVDPKKLAVVGFCWGGAVAWLACERMKDFRAGVAWYGRLTAPPAGDFLGDAGRQWPLTLVRDLKAPVLGLYAGKDQGIPVTDVARMRQALAAAHKKGSELVVYPDAQHGFHADYRASYDPAAAKDGWTRMLEHLKRNGVGPGR
jgi:carboxymethylenebutenolidase